MKTPAQEETVIRVARPWEHWVDRATGISLFQYTTWKEQGVLDEELKKRGITVRETKE